MKRWRITYPDNTSELVDGIELRVWNEVLTIDRGSKYNRRPRSWPLRALRSWEEVS